MTMIITQISSIDYPLYTSHVFNVIIDGTKVFFFDGLSLDRVNNPIDGHPTFSGDIIDGVLYFDGAEDVQLPLEDIAVYPW